MLPWLRKNLNRKQQLILKVVVAVVILHLLLLVAFFFLGNTNTFKRSITLNAMPSSDMKVVFLPMYKSIKNQPVNTQNKTAIAQPKAPQPSAAKTVPKAVPKKPAPKPVPKPAATQLVSKKPVEKPAAKPAAQKPVPVKQAPKPVTPKKAPLEEASLEKALLKQEAEKKEDATVQLPAHLALGDENIVYVGQEEHMLIKIQEHLQSELARCWKAPVTIAEGLACDLLVKVDSAGHASQVKIASSSGAKLYDMLAQKAFRAINYPTDLWGQEITFTFKGQ